MADPIAVGSPSDQNPNSTTYASEFDSLQIPPLDSLFFSDPNHTVAGDPFIYSTPLDLGFQENEDFELTFDDLDDLYLPSEAEDFIISDQSTDSSDLAPDVPLQPCQEDVEAAGVCVCSSKGSESSARSCDCKFLDSQSSKLPTADSGCLSTDSGGWDSKDSRIVNCASPDHGGGSDQEFSGGPASSQGSGSGNCGSGASEGMNLNCLSSNGEDYDVIVDQKIKPEEIGKSCMTKRKKELDEGNLDLRSSKYRRSSEPAESTDPQLSSCALNEDGEKKKARLMRNRESAQLSRQRKKHYVEELEDKVRTMHSTIAELNGKISYMIAENTGLRQQLSGSGMCQPPPHGMYPHPSMAPLAYPWLPCAPYVVKPQGSQLPLVPIPRLKPQHPAPVARGKKNESKKAEGRTKKVASVSFLGLLFFIMYFGGLVPTAKVKFGDVDGVRGKVAFVGDRLYNQNRGRVLRVDGNLSDGVNVGTSCGKSDTLNRLQCDRIYRKERDLKFDQRQKESQHMDDSHESMKLGNASGPLVASLYVPRNDKLVKIDGNLIIHSFLSSEKALASSRASDKNKARETGLAIPRDLNPALTVPNIRANGGKHPNVYRKPAEQPKALTSGSTKSLKDHIKATTADGKLQQWFREGLAGPMLSSGLCTEVFQFDVSSTSPGAIIPASSIANTSGAHRKNATHLNKGRNRRILGRLPVPLRGSSNFNITEEPVRNPHKDSFPGNNKTSSSMVVSVLIDPREAGDSEVDGVITPKSLTRVFVVVLLDSVKYVTYSCVLPRMGPHLVST